MTEQEAVHEAAKHIGFYRTVAERYVRSGWLRASEVDDVVQDAYVRCVESLKSYDPAKGRPTTYLFMPSRSAVREVVRSNSRYALSKRVRRHGVKTHDSLDEPLEDRPKTTPVSELLRRHLSGLTAKALAKELGVETWYVRGLLAVERAVIRDIGMYAGEAEYNARMKSVIRNANGRLSFDDASDMMKMIDNGMTLDEVAVRYGIHKNNVWRWIRKIKSRAQSA